MEKREKKELLVAVIVLSTLFLSVAVIGWIQSDCTITYYYGFENKYETQVVERGYVKEPLDPGRYGYLFDGWYYIDTFGHEVLFDFNKEKVNSNIDLTAHWRPHETVARLNANGGKCEIDECILLFGEKYSLPIPMRTGYYFAGWVGYDSDTYSTGTWNTPYAEVVFVAHWSKVRPDSEIKLGYYEQDGNNMNGKEKIKWIVIDKIDGNYLLVSKYVIDSLPMNNEKGAIGIWSESDIRKWLNEEFYNSVFSEDEKSLIVEMYDNKLKTSDRVFLLSESETKMLIGLDVEGLPTQYAKSKGFSGSVASSYKDVPWWIRAKKPSLRIRGSIVSGTLAANFGLRPAILVSGEAESKFYISE